ncbi:MAG TPA: ATP-binding protein [Chitinophagaceae bacterium]|nr:ATP-binding protein [Chitinophagaceae bacterium]
MKLSTRILLGFSIVLVLSIIDTSSNYLLSVKVERNTEFLGRSQEIIRNSARLHKSIIDMQSSFRGYLLTQDTNFLEGYTNGLDEIPILFNEQEDLIRDNPEHLPILDSIKFLHSQWISYANTLIDSRKNMESSPESGRAYERLFESQLKRQVGKKINDEITQKFSDFDKIEYKARNTHSNNLIESIRRTHIYSLTFFTLTIIIGIITTVYIVYLISRRIKTMVKLAESISRGEFTTLADNKSDELTRLSSSLNIMSENLRRNINELQSRNAELDKFAYVVSHDLKAPVRGIHNVIKWIEEDLGNELSPQMKKYLDIIPQKTKRMEDLINGLLDYARIRKKTEPEQTDVDELVSQIAEDIVPANYKVEIKNLPVIFAEKIKLEQVFTNLISNSVKYSSRENALIIIACKESEDHYEFSVKDNGIGIEPEYHNRIFEMFQTLREKDEKESTGIGLAIIKKILDEQHCSIKVNSTLGKGAEFVFTWPRININ